MEEQLTKRLRLVTKREAELGVWRSPILDVGRLERTGSRSPRRVAWYLSLLMYVFRFVGTHHYRWGQCYLHFGSSGTPTKYRIWESLLTVQMVTPDVQLCATRLPALPANQWVNDHCKAV
jgi:hypothetical protein